MADYYLLSGRLFIAFMFVLSGASKLTFFSHGLDEVRSRNLPFPRLVLSLTILVQLTCGLAIVAGYQTGIAALLLAAFTLATAVVLYDFWNQKGAQRMLLFTGFLEHISIIGVAGRCGELHADAARRGPHRRHPPGGFARARVRRGARTAGAR
ncbi:Protein DoxX [Cupriavidus necator]|uniref:DoxX family protein n=1 Tax=Cupriavidus necator TaxID=106590 RepID=UPI003F734D0D